MTDASLSGAVPAAVAVPKAPAKSAGAWALDTLIWGGLAVSLINLSRHPEKQDDDVIEPAGSAGN